MRHYIVDVKDSHFRQAWEHTEPPLGMLASFYYFKRFDFTLFPEGVDLILDSGAFSAWSLGGSVSLEDYGKFLTDFPKPYSFAFNLDVIGDADASLFQWHELRSGGVETVPVIHFGSNPAESIPPYLEAGAGRLAISGGAMREVPIARRLRWQAYVHRWLKNNAPEIPTHGLGIHMKSQLSRLPWDSIDSSSFSSAWRFGTLELWDTDRRRWYKVKMDGREIYRYGALVRSYGIEPSNVSLSTAETRPELIRLATRVQIRAARDFNAHHGYTRHYMAESNSPDLLTEASVLGENHVWA